MTNRINYTDLFIPNPATEEAELWELVNFLIHLGKLPTLENCRMWLEQCLAVSPDEWILTVERLEVLYPAVIVPALERAKAAA